MSKEKLAVVNELAYILLTKNLTEEDKNIIKNKPKEFINKHININLDDIDVQAVENNNNEVNITLPYYKFLENNMAAAMSDEDLEQVSGGHVFIFSIYMHILQSDSRHDELVDFIRQTD